MDSQIVKGILTASATIIAAIIAYKSQMRRKKTIEGELEFDKLLILGVNLAKIGWGKVFPSDDLKSIQSITIDLLNEMEMKKSIIRELDDFILKEETINETNLSLVRIKQYFGNHIKIFYGKKGSDYFYIGFNLVNIAVSIEVLSIFNAGADSVLKQLKGITIEAKKLKLPTKKISDAFKKKIKLGIRNNEKKLLDESRQLVIETGEDYLSFLRKKQE